MDEVLEKLVEELDVELDDELDVVELDIAFVDVESMEMLESLDFELFSLNSLEKVIY
jgi:hypothetical protein